MEFKIPYYKSGQLINVADARVKAVLTPSAHSGNMSTESRIVEEALTHPVESSRLADLAEYKQNILIITSDHTRPVPSRVTMPILLKEARLYNHNAQIKILIATGFHRATTENELKEKFGADIFESETFVVHNAFNDEEMTSKGILPSGGELIINKLIDWADLIVSEGFIEPHFFAGFSGGRKSILPGICSKDTIMYNHNAEFIAHSNARAGILHNNPLHQDMLYAAKAVGLAFILNVALDENKRVIAAFAGHPVAAHLKGCEFVKKHSSVPAVKSDIVVTSNSGYPLDQNIYQTVKGLATAESCVNHGGVIIMISSCADGHGGEEFYRWFADAESPAQVESRICAIPRGQTRPDQWEAQVLARVLIKCKAVIIVSQHVSPQLIKDMHMLHAETFDEALETADSLLGVKSGIVIIPDGIQVIVEER